VHHQDKSNQVIPPSKNGYSEAARFLEMLEPDGINHLFVSFPDDEQTGCRPFRGTLKQADRWIRERQDSGWGVFVTVQAMKGADRKKDQVKTFRAIFADFDNGLPDDLPLEPSIVVESSPRRFHFYWLTLDAAPITAVDFAGIMGTMIAAHGADNGAKDAARVLRLPGTFNKKPKLKKPFPVRIAGGNGLRYSRAELLKAFPPAAPAPALRIVSDSVVNIDSAKPYVAGAVRGACNDVATAPAGERNTVLYKKSRKVGVFSKNGHVNESEAKGLLLEAASVHFGVADYTEAEAKQTIENGFKDAAGDGAPNIPEPARARVQKGTTNNNLPAPIIGDVPNWPDCHPKTFVPRANSQANALAFFEWKGIAWSYNEFDYETRFEIDGVIRRLDDDSKRRLWLEMDALGCACNEKKFWAFCLNEGIKRSFHPVKKYFAGLKWNKTPRLNGWLTTYVGAPRTPLNDEIGRKVLIAAVRRIASPGAKFDNAMLLEGKQGIGKSEIIRALASNDWFTDALLMGASSKVVMEITAGKLIVEFAELAGLRNKDIETTKAMLSRQSDRERMAYGHMTEERPRQFVFIGSVNPGSKYLRDQTGNRRFWPVVCGAIDVAGMRRDRDQLWAEAVHAEAKGESLLLPAHLWGDAAVLQNERTQEDPWLDTIRLSLTKASDADDADELMSGRVAIEDLWAYLNLKNDRQDAYAAGRINEVMTKLGYRKARMRRRKTRTPCYVADPDPQTWLEYSDVANSGKGAFNEGYPCPE